MNSPLKNKSLSQQEVENARRLLGLGECATIAEIKNAFRSMAKKYHPDKSAYTDGPSDSLRKSHESLDEDKLKCEEMMKKINEAYETILAFISSYRYCFNQKPAEEEYWEDFKERFYEDFII